ncbi:TerB N-terminal domain-containing protein [Paenibacillus sp. IHBB 10380]|uniref:TerB N-terminal domain-containing protein n=1 Tax=Paenibacillus sp. IHBB 10380 TaxID=1566358 RepID=UPI000696FBB5|nr:TerB N-terminal domain-containing protein [Paenibacillus sp. IHBB 10380]
MSEDKEPKLGVYPMDENSELILKGYTEMSKGVGTAFAIPVLTVGDQRFNAADISREIRPGVDIVRVGNRDIPVDQLRELGIGLMGRTIHGALMDKPYKLTPLEVIYRGSERLQGAWSRIEFPDLVWPYGGEHPVLEHLEFLSKWGLNGGIKGGALHHAVELRMFMEYTVLNYPEARVLVVGKKNLLDKLKVMWHELDALWLVGTQKPEAVLENITNSIVIAAPNVAKQAIVQTISFDIMIMLEPDDLTKSTTTQMYKQLKRMKSRIKLAVYSEEGYVTQPKVSTVHMNLLKISDYTLQQYAIYNPKHPRKELPRAYQRMQSTPTPVPSPSLHLTEIDVGMVKDQKGSPIPRREAGHAPLPVLPLQQLPVQTAMHDLASLFKSVPNMNKLGSVPEHRFTRRARELVDRTESYALFVPYMNYWPTYDSMTAVQSKWYFYWRGAVRRGEYPDTDLSYIFLYVYELINGVGWSDAVDGYHLMVAVWVAYRERHLKLNDYLINWIADYVLVHQLDVSLDIFDDVLHQLSGDLLEIEMARRFNADPLDIPFPLMRKLSDYDISKSKFYNEGGSALFEEYAPKVLTLVDSYVLKQQNMRLINIFYPGLPLEKERFVFRSAMYDDSLFGGTITVHLTRISEHMPLREFMTQLVRVIENKLREIRNFKGKLRGIEIEPEIERLVSRYLDRELNALPIREQKGPAVVIDAEKLAQLQQDSEFVRDILTVDLDDTSQDETHLEPMETEESFNGEIWKAGDLQARYVNDNDNEMDVESEIEPMASISPMSSISWDTTGIPEEWQQWVQALSSSDLEALYVLKQGLGYSELQRIAQNVGTMPELLLDGINEVAMDMLGDLVIDGDDLMEEYVPLFAKLTRGEPYE